MKNLDNFKVFEEKSRINEERQLESRSEIISKVKSMKKGECIVANKGVSKSGVMGQNSNSRFIDLDKVDFRRIAKTWVGKVINFKNIMKNFKSPENDYNFEKGEILFVSEGGSLGHKARATLEPYMFGIKHIVYNIGEKSELSDDECALLGLLLTTSVAEIKNLKDLPKRKEGTKNTEPKELNLRFQ